MVLTVTLPLPDTKWGPGFDVRAFSDFIGPLEADSFWRLTLTAPPNEDVLGIMLHPAPGVVLLQQWTSGSLHFPAPVGARDEWTTGSAAQLQVELVEPTGGVIEDESVPIILDREAGVAWEVINWIRERMQTPNSELLTAQGEQLTRVEASMGITSGVLPVDLVGGLADALINGPGLGVGSLSAAYVLTGDGEMPDIGTTFRTRLGIYFVATAIPAGLGHKHGQSEEYPARLVQWRTIHSVGGVEVVTEVLDFITHGEIWRWREAKPLRIEYSILPGVTLSARWHWWP